MKMDLNIGDTQLILDYCGRKGLLRNQVAYILGTSFWETGHTMLPVEEAGYLQPKYNWTDERMDQWRKENLRYYPWYGRGYTQTTWEQNYQRLKQATGVDVIEDPAKAMMPDVAVVALVDGIMEGWWTGKKLSDYVTLKKSNFVGARRCVNGTDKAQAIAELARDYDDTLRAIGYGINEPIAVVANEKRDGTPPKSSPAQSTTIWAAGTSALALIASYAEQAKQAIGVVTESLGVSPDFAVLLVGLAATAWIFRERIRKFVSGDDR